MDRIQNRCEACRHRLFDLATLTDTFGRVYIKCPKCKTVNVIDLATSLIVATVGQPCAQDSLLKYQASNERQQS